MPHALVTGALGGIGQSICSVLEGKGYRVIAFDKRDGRCAASHFIRCDIQDFHVNPAGVEPVVREVRRLCGGTLELLVNNAAHQVVKPVGELKREDWDATLSTNLTAAFMLIQEFLPEIEACRGSIVNVASIHANLTKPGFAAYATSKGGLVALTRALAVELGPRGVRVNAVLPAATETPMLRAGFEGNPEGYAQLAAIHPIGRIAKPEEIAEFIAYLASDKAGFITGSALQIDGGMGGRLHDPV
jgi:NAD(P)-dependent dehydrogenase (short-subunit alcohol dehydrogenase family)